MTPSEGVADGRASFQLILIVDGPTTPWPSARADLEAALAAVPRGAALVLDRDVGPGAPGGPSDRARLRRLAALRELTAAHGAPLGVTGRVDLALAAGAEAVQLPERGLPADAVRARFAGLWVGRSCHDRPGLLAAAAAGARWATLSPVAAPWSKAPTGPLLGVDGFAAATAGVDMPVYGLGGVDRALAEALRAVGAAGVATLGGVLGRPDPAARARALIPISPRSSGARAPAPGSVDIIGQRSDKN